MKTTCKIATLLLTIAVAITSVVHASDYKQKFWDVPKTHWAFEYISDLTTRNVICGYEDGSFKPEATVTRAEWAKMMCVAGNLNVYDTKVYFNDTEGHWANTYINAAKNYITTYNGISFRPDQAIVREDVTRALVELRGYDISDVDYSYIMEFKDFNSISNSMKAYVAVAVEKSLISGFEDSTFRGQATLTRAQAAALLYRAFQQGDASKSTEVPSETYEKPVISEVSKEEVKVDNVSNVTSSQPENEASTPVQNESNEVEKQFEEKTVTKIENVTASSFDHISTNGTDTLYYISDEKVYQKNIHTGSTLCMADLNTLCVDNEYSYKSEFDVYSLCYDKYTGGILLFGKYNVVNSATDNASEYLYSITEEGIEVLSTNIPENICFIVDVLNNGDIVSETSVWDRDTLEYKYNYASYVEGSFGRAMWGYSYDVAEREDALNFVGIYELDPGTSWSQRTLQVVEYDYTKINELWEISGVSFGISQDYVAALNENCLYIYNMYGKPIKTIGANVSETLPKLYILDNYIAYYDVSRENLVVVEF